MCHPQSVLHPREREKHLYGPTTVKPGLLKIPPPSLDDNGSVKVRVERLIQPSRLPDRNVEVQPP